MLEGSSAGQAQGFFQLGNELPGIECVEEVNVAGPSAENLQREILAVFHINAGGFLVGVASVLKSEFLHHSFPPFS